MEKTKAIFFITYLNSKYALSDKRFHSFLIFIYIELFGSGEKFVFMKYRKKSFFNVTVSVVLSKLLNYCIIS